MKQKFIIAREEATGVSEDTHRIKQLKRLGIVTTGNISSVGLILTGFTATGIMVGAVVGATFFKLMRSDMDRTRLTESWLRRIARLSNVDTKLSPIEAGKLLREHFPERESDFYYDS